MMIECESRCESGWNCRPGALKSLSAETFIQLRHISEEPFQFTHPRHVRRRSTRPPELCVEHFPRQPVLGSRDSTINSCMPCGSYGTCSHRRNRSIARHTVCARSFDAIVFGYYDGGKL